MSWHLALGRNLKFILNNMLTIWKLGLPNEVNGCLAGLKVETACLDADKS